MKRSTKELALSGLFTGLGVVILLLGALIGVLDLSAAAIAALLIAVAASELSPAYPPLIYAATGGLALLLLPDKLAAIVYLLITGHYPFIRRYLDKLPRAVAWICKFAVFNLALSAVLGVGFWFLSLDLTFAGTKLEGFGGWVIVALYLLGNVVFYLYEVILARFDFLYQTRWRKRLGLHRYLNDDTKK